MNISSGNSMFSGGGGGWRFCFLFLQISHSTFIDIINIMLFGAATLIMIKYEF